jgi:hypothetical protein
VDCGTLAAALVGETGALSGEAMPQKQSGSKRAAVHTNTKRKKQRQQACRSPHKYETKETAAASVPQST